MTDIARAASIADLRDLSRKRLPRFAFDFIDGGAEDEFNMARSRRAFDDIQLLPRYLVDVSAVDTGVELFGRTYAMPFGIAPIGFLNLAWPGADMMMARLAGRKKIPYGVSTASSTVIEPLAEAADGHAWFQLYVSSDDDVTGRLMDRAKAAGCDVLMVTVDVPLPGKRDRDIRNGLKVPFAFDARTVADLLMHPAWSLATLRAGAPSFGNFSSDQATGTAKRSLAETQARMISARFVWEDLRRLRDRWQGPLIVKGLLDPRDAVAAVEIGCDAIVVSSHGGRQADFGPAPVTVLPDMARAVAGRVPLILDSGVRRGADAVRAKALGADLVLAGRAFAYGAAAAGPPGVDRAFEILESELTRALAQVGCPRFDAVDNRVLVEKPSL